MVAPCASALSEPRRVAAIPHGVQIAATRRGFYVQALVKWVGRDSRDNPSFYSASWKKHRRHLTFLAADHILANGVIYRCAKPRQVVRPLRSHYPSWLEPAKASAAELLMLASVRYEHLFSPLWPFARIRGRRGENTVYHCAICCVIPCVLLYAAGRQTSPLLSIANMTRAR